MIHVYRVTEHAVGRKHLDSVKQVVVKLVGAQKNGESDRSFGANFQKWGKSTEHCIGLYGYEQSFVI